MISPLDAGFILHRRPFSDSSLLLEAFTLGEGRQPLIARGARGPRTRFAQLQPFAPLWLGWRGRGEIRTLGTAESRGAVISLSAQRLYCGMYLNELLMRLTPRGEPFERLFAVYEQSLAALAADVPMDQVLRGFELDLLEELGYGMQLTRAADDAPVEPDAWYDYEPSAGPRRLASAGAGAVAGVTLIAMAGRDFRDAEVRRQALRLMRRILDHYLEHRALKSRELFTRQR